MSYTFVSGLIKRAYAMKKPTEWAHHIAPDGTRRTMREVAAVRRSERKVYGKKFVKQAAWWQSEHELVVQLPIFVRPWRSWAPHNTPAYSRMKREHRRTIHAMCLAAFRESGWKISPNEFVFGLKANLIRIGLVRIAPNAFDDDSLSHSFHHYRDGAYDLLGGYKPMFDKQGKPTVDKHGKQRVTWLGQYLDKGRGKGNVPCLYNEFESGDEHGMQVVFFLSGSSE